MHLRALLTLPLLFGVACNEQPEPTAASSARSAEAPDHDANEHHRAEVLSPDALAALREGALPGAKSIDRGR